MELESSLEALIYAGRILESMMDLLIVLNPDGTMRTVNRAAEEILGYTSAELGGNGFGCILAEKGLESAISEKVVSGDSFRDLETFLKSKNGARIPVSINSSAMHGEDKELDAIVVVAREMRATQRLPAMAEQALASEEIIEGMLEAVTILDLDGTILHINGEFERGTGWKWDEAVGKKVMELGLLPEQTIRRIEKEVIPELMSEGFVRNFETTVLRKDGTEFTALISWTLMKATDGNPIAIINAARDITDLKLADEKLRESEERLKILFEKAPDAYYLNDLEGRFVDGNEAAEELIGYRRKELIGKNFLELDLLPVDQVQKAVDCLKRNTRGERTGPDEFILNCKDGIQISVEISTFPVKVRGEPLVLGLARDITERKRAESMREKYMERIISAQDKERRRIARELHDETGQWIGSLLAGLSMLEGSTSDESAKKYAKDLRHMTSMTLREIQRMSRGLHPSLLDTMGLAAAIEHCASDFSTVHRISVKTEVLGIDGENRLPNMLETTIYRVVQESLTNVARHAEANTASVFIVRQQSIVRVVVEDDGKGFEPGSELEIYDGKQEGFGLTSIRERVELLHGSMRIESSPGEGTTVAIEIPLGVHEP